MDRHVTPEHMDRPSATREELREALHYIRWVNRRLGGTAALLRHLQAWSVRWPRNRPITLLDVATGSADIPLAARRWARAAGFDLRITAMDLHPTTLDLAREHAAGEDGITFIQGDALELRTLFSAESFDYVHAGMFLHHLREIQILTVLAGMHRVSRAGVVWNDLVRSRLAAGAIHVLTLGAPPMVRHDARVSVRAGFTRCEVLDYARRCDLAYCRYSQSFFAQRFTLAGELPLAWAK